MLERDSGTCLSSGNLTAFTSLPQRDRSSDALGTQPSLGSTAASKSSATQNLPVSARMGARTQILARAAERELRIGDG